MFALEPRGAETIDALTSRAELQARVRSLLRMKFLQEEQIATERLRVAFGMGFRAVARPNVVGKVDVGFGEEGARLFVGLGYPF